MLSTAPRIEIKKSGGDAVTEMLSEHVPAVAIIYYNNYYLDKNTGDGD